MKNNVKEDYSSVYFVVIFLVLLIFFGIVLAKMIYFKKQNENLKECYLIQRDYGFNLPSCDELIKNN